MKTLRRAFSEKYPERTVIISIFEETTGTEFAWSNITKAVLYDFVKGMKEKVSNNSAKTYASMLKSILNLYSDQVELPSGWADVLTVHKEESEHIYLDIDEVKMVAAYQPKDMTERLVKNAFILSCLTGARHSDAMQFSMSNVRGEWISYVSKKTHIKASIPASPMVLNILKENEECGLVGKSVSDVTFNATIRNICMKCEINEPVSLYVGGKSTSGKKYEFVASHTARRSFATNLYLYQVDGKYPFDILRISKMMGHNSVDMTNNYLMAERPFSEEENSFFAKF